MDPMGISWASTSRSFSRKDIFDLPQLIVLGFAGVCTLGCLLVACCRTDKDSEQERQGYMAFAESGPAAKAKNSNEPQSHQSNFSNITQTKPPFRYRASTAWLKGFAFFGVCFMISWSTGVLSATFFTPLTTSGMDWRFNSFTAACFVVVLVGYWGVWPRGTVTYGRTCTIPWCVLFGVVDGLAEAQLFLSFWAVVELGGLPRWATASIVFLVQGGFKANWDQMVWNVQVAPKHNIQEYNKWKILLVHIPNVLVTFSYFVTYSCAPLYVATQTVALVGSTCAMAFPKPTSTYTNPPQDSLVVFYSDRQRADRWDGHRWV